MTDSERIERLERKVEKLFGMMKWMMMCTNFRVTRRQLGMLREMLENEENKKETRSEADID